MTREHRCAEIRIRFSEQTKQWVLYRHADSVPFLRNISFCPYCGEKLMKGDAG